ncbi:hypothetical protein CLPU_10c00180 [Gottschalkia purinilytica]|uniref:ABC-2 family transporter protein n=1 Tax=Gottschalkia purinilytica TaxID=1503 RepID=A0A0L0W8W1_GOTPU|nr:hypothetical protein [Gottschalkia purinilytica]KNF07964.1 hypothetical protein CLPU_10c00180 [Gottschalkia purinilytica]
MESLKKQLKFHYLYNKKAFLIFWGIVIAFNIFGIIYNSFIRVMVNGGTIHIGIGLNSGGKISNVGGNYIPIIIYIIVTSIMMYSEAFKALIGFSSTRKDSYKGIVAFHVVLSLAMTIVQVVLLNIESIIIPLLGLNKTYLSFNEYFPGGIYLFLITFAIFLASCGVLNLISGLSYRFGKRVWIYAAVIVIFAPVVLMERIILPIYNMFLINNLFTIFLFLISISVICFYLGWISIRKCDLKK